MTKKSAAAVDRREAAKKAERDAANAVPPQIICRKPGDIVDHPVAVIGGKPIVYLYKVLSLTDRAAVRHQQIANRGIEPDTQTIRAVLRRGIDAVLKDPQENDQAHFAVDQIEAFADDVMNRLVDTSDPQGLTAAQEAALKEAKKRAAHYTHVEQIVRRGYAPYRELDADISYAREISRIIMLKNTLVGWNDYSEPFETDANGQPTDETLMRIPQDHWYSVSGKSYDVFKLSAATIKNSAPPS